MSDTLRVSNLHFGNVASNYNQPQMGFTSVGIGSTTNYGFLQFFGTSNTLCWTANGTVGIGTTNPLARLTIRNGYSDGDTGGLCIDASDGSVYNMRLSSFNPAASQVSYRFGVNNLAASLPNTLVLAYNGRVGIGKSVPTSSLDVTGNLFVNNGVVAFAPTEYQGLQLSYTGTGATGYGSIIATNPGATYNPLCLNPFGGNVGIGTATPIAPLHVVNPSNGLTSAQFVGESVTGAQWRTIVGNYSCSAGSVLTIPIVSQMGNWSTTMIRIRGFNGTYNTTTVRHFTAECVANTLGTGYGNFTSISVGGNVSSVTFNTTSVAVLVNFTTAYGSGSSIALVIEYLSTISAITIIPASISVN